MFVARKRIKMWGGCNTLLFAKTDYYGDGEYKDVFHQKDTEWLNEQSKNAKASIKKFEKNQCLDKNENIAQTDRVAGNKLFEAKKYQHARQEYNRSLCYSKMGLGNMGLAYANRSACFSNMKMYDKCLIDIDLAIKAGFPDQKIEELMEKLKNRRIDCNKLIDEDELVRNKKST